MCAEKKDAISSATKMKDILKSLKDEEGLPSETPKARSCHFYPSMSNYCGEWARGRWEGRGTYTFAHGVKFVGQLADNDFHGEGLLIYPNGQRITGKWNRGKLVNWAYEFKDKTAYNPHWNYCVFPDRRYTISKSTGLNPPGQERLTTVEPTPPIPQGCFDLGEGMIFNPQVCCVLRASDFSIIRVPCREEENWILSKCRVSSLNSVGYMPELYEFWCNGTKESVAKICEKLQSDETNLQGEGEGA